MKNFQYVLLLILFTAFVAQPFGFAQFNSDEKLEYVVEKVFKPLSISKEKLNNAETVGDLREHFKPSWVREYLSVEILTTQNGSTKKAINKIGKLSEEQKTNMQTNDAGKDISVKIKYIPENNLKNNDAKEMNFSFLVYPEQEASYPGGQKKLQKYLKKNAIDKIPEGIITSFELAAVKFTVTKDGKIINPKLAWSSNDENVDKLLLETVQNMPSWKPAEFANGTKIDQEFAFAVGNMESCVVNILNIRPLPREEESENK